MKGSVRVRIFINKLHGFSRAAFKKNQAKSSQIRSREKIAQTMPLSLTKSPTSKLKRRTS